MRPSWFQQSFFTHRTLTKILLKKDFGIEWDIPDSHLAPGLTGRINYLNWINEVLNLVPENPNSTRQGIDVGTGASCIYPLLGNALYGWKFDATDIDEESVDASLHLIQLNRLEEHIRVHKRTPEQPLLSGFGAGFATAPITFSMCNPPFFSNADEVS